MLSAKAEVMRRYRAAHLSTGQASLAGYEVSSVQAVRGPERSTQRRHCPVGTRRVPPNLHPWVSGGSLRIPTSSHPTLPTMPLDELRPPGTCLPKATATELMREVLPEPDVLSV